MAMETQPPKHQLDRAEFGDDPISVKAALLGRSYYAFNDFSV